MTKVLTLQTSVILELLLESKELPVGYWFERDSFTMVKTSVRAFALRSVFNGVFTQHQFTRPHNSLFLWHTCLFASCICILRGTSGTSPAAARYPRCCVCDTSPLSRCPACTWHIKPTDKHVAHRCLYVSICLIKLFNDDSEERREYFLGLYKNKKAGSVLLLKSLRDIDSIV